MCIELLLLTMVVACKCQVPLLKPFREPLLFSNRIQLTLLHRILFGILILSTVRSWDQKLLTSGTTLLLMVHFLSANHKSISIQSCITYILSYAYIHQECMKYLLSFLSNKMLINQKYPHMKCKVCTFLVLSNQLSSYFCYSQTSFYLFFFFVGVSFCLTVMLQLIMASFLPKCSGVKLQGSIVDDCPLYSKQKSGDCCQQL